MAFKVNGRSVGKTISGFQTKNAAKSDGHKKLSAAETAKRNLALAMVSAVTKTVKGLTDKEKPEKPQTPPYTPTPTLKREWTSHSGTRKPAAGSVLSDEVRLRLWSRLLLRVRKAQIATHEEWQRAVEEWYAKEEAEKAEMAAWVRTWQEEHAEANEASKQQMEVASAEQRRRERL